LPLQGFGLWFVWASGVCSGRACCPRGADAPTPVALGGVPRQVPALVVIVIYQGGIYELWIGDWYQTTIDSYQTMMDSHQTTIDSYQTTMDNYQTTMDSYQTTMDRRQVNRTARECSRARRMGRISHKVGHGAPCPYALSAGSG
jgi:hypothetical protein